ncbi:hypothetical protein [Flavobacterium undicola]|uniref:hypothetical protein n=1 Tax=Flavobacterium undicola TaxID=1932779 RepID=UPI0013771841|nr:hypothetical protein [Flavobacterium undicola]MBA0883292.1 hypothetical protein [Flavobacterium undicola]
MTKYLILSLSILVIACNGQKKSAVLKDSFEIIKEREQQSMQKDYSEIGELVSEFDFKVKTANIKDFEDGFIPWADLEKPDSDLANLDKKDEIVVSNKLVKIVIDYPLTNQYEFTLESENGFTRGQLLTEISKHYYLLYEEEEKTATIKTIPIEKRTTMYNRNETNGKYGIWGHDIADMDISGISVYKTKNGEIILILNIES